MDSLRAAQIHNALATLCKKMDKELLYKYINGQTSEQEEKNDCRLARCRPQQPERTKCIMVYAGRTYRKCPLSAPPPSAAADQTPEMVSPALYSYLYPGCRSITIGRWQLVRFQNRHYRRYRKTISVRCRTGRTTYRHYTPGRNQRLPEQRGKTGISDTVQ